VKISSHRINTYLLLSSLTISLQIGVSAFVLSILSNVYGTKPCGLLDLAPFFDLKQVNAKAEDLLLLKVRKFTRLWLSTKQFLN
jgi:hypothetical protein